MKIRYVIALFLALGLFGAFDSWLDPLFAGLSRATVSASPRSDVIYAANVEGLQMQLTRDEVCALGAELESQSYLRDPALIPIMNEMRESMQDMDDIHWRIGRTTLVNYLVSRGISASDANTTVDGLRLMYLYDREC